MLLLEQILVTGLGAGVKVGRLGLTNGERKGLLTSIGLTIGLTWLNIGVSLPTGAWWLTLITSFKSFLEPLEILDVVVEIVQIVGLD